MSLAVLVIAILAMVFEKQIGIKLQVSASVGAIILILTGVISEKEALKSIDLKTVFLFGGSLALATALEHTGAGSLIADTLIGAMGNEVHPLILLVVIFVITCTMTNFMSNTATTALMVPIAVSLAQGLGADPARWSLPRSLQAAVPTQRRSACPPIQWLSASAATNLSTTSRQVCR